MGLTSLEIKEFPKRKCILMWDELTENERVHTLVGRREYLVLNITTSSWLDFFAGNFGKPWSYSYDVSSSCYQGNTYIFLCSDCKYSADILLYHWSWVVFHFNQPIQVSLVFFFRTRFYAMLFYELGSISFQLKWDTWEYSLEFTMLFPSNI